MRKKVVLTDTKEDETTSASQAKKSPTSINTMSISVQAINASIKKPS